MRTKRDQDIINFLEEEGFHIATSNQIHRLFFANTSYRYSRKRLEYLYNEGHIKRTKSTIDNCFAYYVNRKPVQIHHDLLRTELYSHLKLKYDLLEWNNEFSIVNIRPDALCYIKDNGIVFPCFIEIHLNNRFDFDKYKHLIKSNDLRAMFGIMPRVVLYTDRQITIPAIGIKFKVINIDMNGLDSVSK